MTKNPPSPSDTAEAFLSEYGFYVIEDKGILKVWSYDTSYEMVNGIKKVWKGMNLQEFVHIYLEKFLNDYGLKYPLEEVEEIESLIISRRIPN